MLIKMIALFLFVFGALAIAVVEAAEEKDGLAVISLPKGDAVNGRKAFMDLRCFTCHVVTGEKEMPKAWSANLGPELGKTQAKQTAGRLGSSIVAPSHTVDEETRKKIKDQLSPMGDFSEAMTVRQLLDLIAYIHSLH